MDRKFHLKTVLLGAFILLAFAYVGGHLIAKERLSDLRSELMQQATGQRSLLATIAETTARNGADATTEEIVSDCAPEERAIFDDLLGKLDSGLGKNDLQTLERLFGRCGSFYAERKSVMAARLEREVQVYETYVSQLDHIGYSDIERYQVSLWQALAQDEKVQSMAFSELVKQQDKIISSLTEGKNEQSPELTLILENVKLTKQALADAGARAAEKRKQLLPL